MRDIHPFLVLSPRIFNEKTSLVIGLPMTTAEYNADNPFAVAVGKATGRKTGQTSYVLCHQPKSFDWRLRKAKAHPLGVFVQRLVCAGLRTAQPDHSGGLRRDIKNFKSVGARRAVPLFLYQPASANNLCIICSACRA